MSYGVAHPADKKGPIWGARAIFDGQHIDIVWDRQEMVGGTEEERKALSDWLNNVGLPWLRAEVKRIGLKPEDRDQIGYGQGSWSIHASPKGSCGYLYISAWGVE